LINELAPLVKLGPVLQNPSHFLPFRLSRRFVRVFLGPCEDALEFFVNLGRRKAAPTLNLADVLVGQPVDQFREDRPGTVQRAARREVAEETHGGYLPIVTQVCAELRNVLDGQVSGLVARVLLIAKAPRARAQFRQRINYLRFASATAKGGI